MPGWTRACGPHHLVTGASWDSASTGGTLYHFQERDNLCSPGMGKGRPEHWIPGQTDEVRALMP